MPSPRRGLSRAELEVGAEANCELGQLGTVYLPATQETQPNLWHFSAEHYRGAQFDFYALGRFNVIQDRSWETG